MKAFTIASAHPNLSGLNVLVVEDNGLLCCVLEETLREAGCKVVGPYMRLGDAMSVVTTARIDVALLDINLHGELVSPLAEQLQERGVPYVVASGYRQCDLPHALQGAVQIRKPYTDNEVLELLASVASAAVKRKH